MLLHAEPLGTLLEKNIPSLFDQKQDNENLPDEYFHGIRTFMEVERFDFV